MSSDKPEVSSLKHVHVNPAHQHQTIQGSGLKNDHGPSIDQE